MRNKRNQNCKMLDESKCSVNGVHYYCHEVYVFMERAVVLSRLKDNMFFKT